MIDERRLFEEAAELFAPPPRLIDGVEKRRSRKRRNRRLGTTVLALIVAIAAIGGLVRAFRAGQGERPAARTIDRSNVSELLPAWTAHVGPAPGLLGASVTAADGRVFVQSDGLYVYPADCSATCDPLWTAPLPAPGTFFAGVSPQGPAVAGGSVLVAAGNRVFAFPLECGPVAATCPPSWSAKVGPGLAYHPVIAGGTAYVGAGDGRSAGRLYAFPVDCGTGGATCPPTWVSPLQPDPLLVQGVSNGVVYATNWENLPSFGTRNKVYAFPASCPNGGCDPLWVAAIHEGHVSITTGAGSIFVGSSNGSRASGQLQAFPESCGLAPPCRASWTVDVRAANPALVYANGVLFVVERFWGTVSAFDAETGLRLWRWCCSAGWSFSTPTVADGLVWVPTPRNGSGAFPVDCEQPCSAEAGWTGPSASGIAVTGTAVFAVSRDGVVTAYRLPPSPRAT